MCTKKYAKDSKEFQIMKQFFDIMKKYGSIDSDERQSEYEEETNAFIEDENPVWRKFKEQLVKSWTEKLQKDREEKMRLMREMYMSMQQYAVMETDDDWKKAVDYFKETLKKYTPSMQSAMQMFTFAWLDKLGADYNKKTA